MAIPLLLPLLFAAGSAGLNYAAANKVDSAQAGAMSRERYRQKELDDQSFALNRQSRERYDDVNGKQAETGSNLAEMFREVQNEQPSIEMPTAPATDNVVVANRNAASSDKAQQQVDERADNLANFRSFADMFGGIGRGVARDTGELGTIAGFKRGSQGVLPLELDAAAQKGQGLRMLADVFNLGSSMMMGPALGGTAMPGYGGGLARLFGG